jgi:hypothetical protein
MTPSAAGVPALVKSVESDCVTQSRTVGGSEK